MTAPHFASRVEESTTPSPAGRRTTAGDIVRTARSLVALGLLGFVLTGCGSLASFGSRIALPGAQAPEPLVTDAGMPQAPVPASRATAPAMPPAEIADASRRVERPIAAPAQPARPPQALQRRPGRYFQHDGPGDIPPELLLAVPDAAPKPEPLAEFANRDYRVFGKTYRPATARQPVKQIGVASWYGRQFHGRKTATGERYDMYAVSAAHTTLPLPSYVRVTNLETKRSIVVRVNDRGPFHPGRIIDLSYAAAAKLGFAHKGSARVAIETIIPGDRSPARLALSDEAAAGR